MIDYGGLIKNISSELGIYKDKKETDKNWFARNIYSSLGRTALASLYDSVEDNDYISIIHFKNRIVKTLDAYRDIFPETNEIFLLPSNEYADEIYDIYLNCGYLYHTPNRISSGMKRSAVFSGIEYFRGEYISNEYSTSGLGIYQKSDIVHDEIDDLIEMFKIPNDDLVSIYNKIISIAKWTEMKSDYDIDYLRVTPPFTNGYWKSNPDKDGNVSLLRINTTGQKTYYLYKFIEDRIMISNIPSWIMNHNSYYTIANCILAKNKALPGISVDVSDKTVLIKQKYILPSEVLNFLFLYSWPVNYEDKNLFNRIMGIDIFNTFIEIINHMGIEVA